MISTPITRAFGLETPIVNAGMAMVARPALAAAVSNAGGLGTIGCDICPPEGLQALVAGVKALTKKPFGVDLIGDFVTDGHIDVLIAEAVPLAIFFWSPPTEGQLARLKAAGTRVWMQVGSVKEAETAVALGVDALIVQGSEAGGHTRAEASTMTLFPRLRRQYPDLPMLAAGGIACGATMAAALVMGADAVWCGSRFLASVEADAHAEYKSAVLKADVGDTVVSTLYGPEWPDQPMRVIVNDGLKAATTAGRGSDGTIIGTTEMGGQTLPVPRLSALLPTRAFQGNIQETCFTAGQSVGNIERLLPAAEIVRGMTEDAREALDRLMLLRRIG